MKKGRTPDVGSRPFPCSQLPKRPHGGGFSQKGAVRVRTLPCESAYRSAHLSRNNTQARGRRRLAVLPCRAVAGGCTGNSGTITPAVACTRNFCDTGAEATKAAASITVTWVAGNSIRRNTRLNAHATLAVAATALTAAIAGCAIRSTRRRRISAGASDIIAVAATALLVLLARLPVALTVIGSSLTHAQRCQRAPYEGSTHQPERPTSRNAAISQSSS